MGMYLEAGVKLKERANELYALRPADDSGNWIKRVRKGKYNAIERYTFGVRKNTMITDFISISISMVSCQMGHSRHAYAWQVGPFWQDTLDICAYCKIKHLCLDTYPHISHNTSWFKKKYLKQTRDLYAYKYGMFTRTLQWIHVISKG